MRKIGVKIDFFRLVDFRCLRPWHTVLVCEHLCSHLLLRLGGHLDVVWWASRQKSAYARASTHARTYDLTHSLTRTLTHWCASLLRLTGDIHCAFPNACLHPSAHAGLAWATAAAAAATEQKRAKKETCSLLNVPWWSPSQVLIQLTEA